MGRPKKRGKYPIICRCPFCKKVRIEMAERPYSIIFPEYCDDHKHLRFVDEVGNATSRARDRHARAEYHY